MTEEANKIKEELLTSIDSLTADFDIEFYINLAATHKQVRKSKIKYAEESIRKFIEILKSRRETK